MTAKWRTTPLPGDVHWIRYVRSDGAPYGRHVDTFEAPIDGLPGSIVELLGPAHIANLRAMANPAAYCKGRARGWWDANDLEYVAIYTALSEAFERLAGVRS